MSKSMKSRNFIKLTHREQTQYLVKWLGYPSEQNSWVSGCDMVSPETTDEIAINSLSMHEPESSTYFPKDANAHKNKQTIFTSPLLYLLLNPTSS